MSNTGSPPWFDTGGRGGGCACSRAASSDHGSYPARAASRFKVLAVIGALAPALRCGPPPRSPAPGGLAFSLVRRPGRIDLFSSRSQGMDETLQAQLAALGDEIRATAIPDAGKHTAAWCLGQLPALYAKLHQTHESRYGEEIARLVQGIRKALVGGKRACPEALQLAVRIISRFRLFHEQF